MEKKSANRIIWEKKITMWKLTGLHMKLFTLLMRSILEPLPIAKLCVYYPEQRTGKHKKGKMINKSVY